VVPLDVSGSLVKRVSLAAIIGMGENHGSMISPKTKIGLLVAAHVVATPTAAWFAWGHWFPHLPFLAWQSVSVAQVTLLGVWLRLGRTKLRWRLTGVILGLFAESVIESVWSLSFGPFGPQSIDSFWRQTLNQLQQFPVFHTTTLQSPALVVTSIVLAIACSRRHLGRTECSKVPTFQFSIRHLMLLIFFVSFLLGIVRLCRWDNLDSETLDILIPLLVDVIPAVIISLSAVWASMTPGRPQLRMATAVLLAGCLGFWKAYCEDWDDWECYAANIATHSLQAIITIASLLVIRSNGWRLVGRKTAP